jgi:hypothetical protein
LCPFLCADQCVLLHEAIPLIDASDLNPCRPAPPVPPAHDDEEIVPDDAATVVAHGYARSDRRHPGQDAFVSGRGNCNKVRENGSLFVLTSVDVENSIGSVGVAEKGARAGHREGHSESSDVSLALFGHLENGMPATSVLNRLNQVKQ